MRIVVWGTGYIANEYMERKAYHLRGDVVVAFVDNNAGLWGERFKNIPIIAPSGLRELAYDRLIICTDFFDEIKAQIEEDLHIGDVEILTYYELENIIKKEIILKYDNSPDPEIQAILRNYEDKPLNIFGLYNGNGRNDIYPVQYDSDKMPYIIFEGKRMFFPRTYPFAMSGNVVCIKDVLYEQGKHSPHLYIKSEDIIREDMVIVDAGVCEGNFALRYVESARKLYLIESDSQWIEALERTFRPYKDKTVICNKYLSDKDTDRTITLDTLVSEKIDLLKMDIDGYEADALRGGERVLRESSAWCSVCSYHRHNDERKIKDLLQRMGYTTDTSEGYMFFPYDSWMEFRRGVVYGWKDREAYETI